MIEEERADTKELRFIYSLILDGLSDTDILTRYTSMKSCGELDFPLRTDETFIKGRRREMEIASEVLKDGIKKVIGILAPKQKDEHLEQIIDISGMLLENNLGTVTVVESLSEATYGWRRRHLYSARYTLKDENSLPLHLDKWQLVERFRKNVENACNRYGFFFFYDCYVSHIKATMGEEMEALGGFWPTVERKPDAVIRIIRDIFENKEIKGTCPLCKIENELPPFIQASYADVFHN